MIISLDLQTLPKLLEQQHIIFTTSDFLTGYLHSTFIISRNNNDYPYALSSVSYFHGLKTLNKSSLK
jgi:hypothetical protein